MKRIFSLFAFILGFVGFLPLNAQEKIVNLYDSANVYYQKKDYKKSAYFYDKYYLELKNGQSNYDTYRAAVASSQIGNFENAKYYIKRSGEIYYDYSGFYEFENYDKFVTDTAHHYLRTLPEWKHFITVLKQKADSSQLVMKQIMAALQDTSARVNQSNLANDAIWKDLAKRKSANDLIKTIKNFNDFPTPKKTGFWTMYQIKVNDTLTVPYLLHIPKNYISGKNTRYTYIFMVLLVDEKNLAIRLGYKMAVKLRFSTK